MSKDKKDGVTEEQRRQIEILSKIDDLIIVQSNHFLISKYKEAIQVAEEIIEIAKEYNLKDHITEQEDYIIEMEGAIKKRERVAAIKELAEHKKKKIDALIDTGDIMAAHRLVEDFVNEFENEVKLKSIPAARQFMKREEEVWEEFLGKQVVLRDQLKTLKEEISTAFESENLREIGAIVKKSKDIVSKILIEDHNPEWKKYYSDYNVRMDKINEEIFDLEQNYEDKQSKNQLSAALEFGKKIIEMARESGIEEFEKKYTAQLDELQTEIDIENSKRDKELEEIKEKAKELENIIKVEEDTLLLVEEFSVNDILGDLSGEINETLEKVGALLVDHRVEIKTNITNKAVLTSASGEIVELNQDIEVVDNKEEPTNYYVKSGLTNPFDDILEEGILTDLIPYNFEIMNIEMNGKKVEEIPEKVLIKDGAQLEWKIENLKPKEKVEIKYDLRRRVSRTIIFMLDNNLKIIKTHSNLKPSEQKGFYDALFPFSNSFGKDLSGVVVEDVIPLYYLHFVKEPSEFVPVKTADSRLGDLVKWNIGTLEQKSLDYHYKLLELYRLEEIKVDVENLDKDGNDAINNGNIVEAIQKYNEIKEVLLNYIK